MTIASKYLPPFACAAAGCLLLLGCGDSGQAPTNVATNNPELAGSGRAEAAERTIEQLEREWAVASVRKDLGWYDRHVSPDYRSVLTDGRIASRADIIEHLTNSPAGQAIRVDAVEVRVHGETAVATVTQSFNTASGRTGRSRITDVWVKSGDRWTVRYSHEGPLRG